MVLIEANSVVVRRAAIDERLAGGWPAFVALVPNATLCTDGALARVGFMTPEDVDAFAGHLVVRGLCFRRAGEAADFAVVDQLKGPTLPCPWLAMGKAPVDGGEVVAASLAGGAALPLATPLNWTFAGSLSDTWGFTPTGATDKALEFLGHREGLDVYRSRLAEGEVYVGRVATATPARGPAPGDTLNAIAQRARAIEAEADAARAERDEPRALRLYDELDGDLLPRARAAALQAGSDAAFAAYCVGYVLRVLDRLEEAAEWYERSLQLRPEVLGTLLELTLCLGTLGRDAEALQAARRGVEVAPDSAAALGNLAVSLINGGDWRAAKATLDRALAIDPGDEQNRGLMEECLRELAGTQ